MMRCFHWLCGVALVFFWGCGAGGGGATLSAADRRPLTVSAASSLSDALAEIKAAYAKSAPEVALTFNFGGSGLLQQQIAHGAPVDLFIAAAPRHIDALVERGLIVPESRRDLLSNVLVLIAPGQGSAALKGLDDLRGRKVRRIMIGDPTSVPAGAYAEQALRSLKLLDAVAAKLVRALNVRQVLTSVETGNVDGGFVYATDAKRSQKSRIVAIVPAELHQPIIYPAAIIAGCRHPEQAKRFLAFLHDDPAARALFLKWGFQMSE
jgi:molybdate transport system substrate-binding protein